MHNEQIEKLMRLLDISAEEAADVIKYDAEIDKGKDPFPLSADQKKVEKEMRQADRKKPTIYNFDKRDRKQNTTKSAIIAELAAFLEQNSESDVKNLEITNAERQLRFTVGENIYELTLVQKRAPKS